MKQNAQRRKKSAKGDSIGAVGLNVYAPERDITLILLKKVLIVPALDTKFLWVSAIVKKEIKTNFLRVPSLLLIVWKKFLVGGRS